MGYALYPVHIKLIKINQNIINQIKEIIARHKTCAWHTFCEGEYDLLLSFKIMSEKDKLDMNQLLWEISDNVSEKEVSLVLYSFEISKSFLPDRKSSRFQLSNQLFPTFDHDTPKIELSPEEMKILQILKANSREMILNMAKDVHLSARVVSSKIRKLQKLKVISGFKTKINTATLGSQPCVSL